MQRDIAVAGESAMGVHLLAVSLAADGRPAEAIPYYREALRLQPSNPMALANLGIALASVGDWSGAANAFAGATALAPQYADAHYGLGVALFELRQFDRARAELNTALSLPLSVDYAAQARFRLGLIEQKSRTSALEGK